MKPSLTTCEHVRQLLVDMAESGELLLPPVDLVEHITTCATCRGALFTLAVAVAELPGSANPINCTACETDLAGYIEFELAQSMREAVQAYPHVWRHMWVCPACTELYHLTRTLESSHRIGTLPPMPIQQVRSVPPALVSHRLHLKRSFLNYTLPRPIAALGPLRGRHRDHTVLVADDDEHNPLTLSVQRQHDNNWRVSVTFAPPLSGWLMLTLGENAFRARFDAHGHAVVSDVPDALLSATDGPDLLVEIDPDSPVVPGG